MNGRYPYQKRSAYPHMIGEDKKVWERFIVKFPERFESVDYDWRVGVGMEIKPWWTENIKRMAVMLSQKRIDVLAWKADTPTIIEVKRRVTIGTIGQILSYRVLFMSDLPLMNKPELLVITEMIGGDDMLVLDYYKIPYEVV